MTAIVIPVELIDVLPGRRSLDPNWVQTLADDFKLRGQRTPIEVLATGERFRLIAGGHRLEARRTNDDATVLAIVKQPESFASEAEIKLAEIVENFMRRELSVLDRAFDVAAWRELFEAVKGAVKPGPKSKGGVSRKVATNSAIQSDDALEAASKRFAESFTEAAQNALGLSRDAIFRALKISRIGESVRQRVALLPIAHNQSELLALVAEPVSRQSAIVDKLIEGAASVADATAIIDNLPPPIVLARWERMSETFSRLKTDEQEAFFRLHEDAILKWIAARAA